MTDTSRAPERIWVDFYPRDWPTERIIYGEMPEPYVEYIREDISDARVAAAYEAAARVAQAAKDETQTEVNNLLREGFGGKAGDIWAGRLVASQSILSDIRALTPADAKDALDRLIAEARHAHRELVEELKAKLRSIALDCLASEGQAAEAYQAQLAAEAKLDKATGALEKVQAFVSDLEPYADQGHTLVPALREACEILVKLKQGT